MATDFEKSSAEDCTESASQFRREEFRKQGTVALSRELLSVAILISVGLSLYFACNAVFTQFSSLSDGFFRFSKVTTFGKMEILDLRFFLLRSWSSMVLPVFVIAVAAGLVACAAQVGFYITWEPLTPNLDRINPLNGIQRLFSLKGAIEALKALLKIGIAGIVLYYFIKNHAQQSAVFYHKNVPEITKLLLSGVSKIFFTMILALSVLAVLDYAYQRWELEKQMKMTRREAKEEFKLREGDPLIKTRIRSAQRRIASRRMMEAVPKADVVVTNPTHLAVALKYDAGSMHAPKVVAKGAGVIAEKIKEIARFHRIPIVENKPLARAIFKEIEINHFIPRELYKAVAEVLAYVYRLKQAHGYAYG